MAVVATPERFGIRKGMLTMIEDLLRIRFGEAGAMLLPEITALADADKFRAMHAAISKAATLEQVWVACAAAAAPPAPTKKITRRKSK